MDSEKEARIINILNSAEQIRDNNNSALESKIRKIKSDYVICIGGCLVGMIIGVIWGASGGALAAVVYGVACAAIGGSFKAFLERAALTLPDCFVHTGNFVASLIIGIIKGIIYLVMCAVIALLETIKNIWNSQRTINKINAIIDEDNECVKLIRDFLEYNRCIANEEGNQLEELVSDGGKLHDNLFAKLVMEHDANYAVDEMNGRLRLLEKNQDIVKEIVMEKEA